MDAERDLIAPIVQVMGDPIAGGQSLRLAQDHEALGVTLAVVPLVNRERAAHSREHGPPHGVRMLASFAPIGHSRTRASSSPASADATGI